MVYITEGVCGAGAAAFNAAIVLLAWLVDHINSILSPAL